ncbi:MAG: hypothetical protein ACR2OI_06880 [Acidimicrobiia bacterium]
MLHLLAVVSIPALLAARLDSAGLAFVAAAGLLWAAGIYLCSTAPVVAGRRRRSVNETLTSALTTLAALLAVVGAIAALLGL